MPSVSAPVQIEYVRSGGIAGLRKTASVDTVALRASDPAAAEHFEQVASALLAEPTPARPQAPRADGFQHALVITRGTEKKSFTACDPTSGESLERLLKLIAPLAKLA